MGKHVMVVDDDPVIRLLITEYLSSFGHSVEALESGSACLERMNGELPDMLVLDLQMPEMNGVEVLERIKNDPRLTNVPVVMLSANEDTSAVGKRASVSPDHFLQKPFQMKEFISVLQKLERAPKDMP